MHKSASLGPLVRFRPLDTEDFSQRAKNLAAFLGTSLVDAQELLARVFGYAHRHEILKRLKVPAVPGPFNEQLDGFKQAVGHDVPRSFCASVREQRDERLMRLVSDWLKEAGRWTDSNRVTLLCDLGLFASPAAHRVAVKTVNSFLEGKSAFTDDGLPLGFKGTLLLRYQANLPLAPAAFDSLRVAQERHNLRLVYEPAEQLKVVRCFRIPHIFREMLFHGAPELLNGPDSIELDMLDEDDSLLDDGNPAEVLLSDLSSMIMDASVGFLEDAAGREFTGEEYQEVFEAINEPSKEPPSLWTFPCDEEDFRKEIARMKLGIRRQLADRFVYGTDDEEGSYQERLRLKQPAYLQLRKANRCLSMLLAPEITEDDIDRWRASATLLLLDETTGLWSAVAAIDADYVIPDEYTEASELVWNFENSASEDLATAWDILETHYVPSIGLKSYDKWTRRGVAVANAFLWVDPKHRGTEVSAWLIEDFVEALRPQARSQDWMWRSWADVREKSTWNSESYNKLDYDYPLTLPQLGVMFLYMPDSRIRGISVWNAAKGKADVKLMDSRDESLEPVFGKLWNVTAAKEPEWMLARRLLDITAAIPVDFVLYDDYSDSASGEEREDGEARVIVLDEETALTFPKARR